MSAWKRQCIESNVGEGPLLPLIDRHPLLSTGVYVVPVLAGDAACLTGIAAVHVEKKSVLGHVFVLLSSLLGVLCRGGRVRSNLRLLGLGSTLGNGNGGGIARAILLS